MKGERIIGRILSEVDIASQERVDNERRLDKSLVAEKEKIAELMSFFASKTDEEFLGLVKMVTRSWMLELNYEAQANYYLVLWKDSERRLKERGCKKRSALKSISQKSKFNFRNLRKK